MFDFIKNVLSRYYFCYRLEDEEVEKIERYWRVLGII